MFNKISQSRLKLKKLLERPPCCYFTLPKSVALHKQFERLDLCSSALSCSIGWYVFTDVSEQPIGRILKGQEIQEEKDFLAHENGTDTLFRNVGTEIPLNAA
jgi:hypothetical protein